MAGDMQADIPESGAVFTYGRSRFANNVASYFFIRNDPIAAISCGDEHTAIVCQNGRVFTFGSNSWGQLGLGHKNTITMPSCMKSLKPEKANQIACGKSHTVISTVSGKVFTCGSNANGQLGIPEVTERTTPTQVTGIEVKPNGIKQVSAGCLHSACLTDDGKVFVWGTNADGQLGLGNVVATADVPTLVKLPKPAAQISCGYYHTAFVTDDGKLYICGEAENGKLGQSETGVNIFSPTLVNIDSPVKFVACGGNHTIAITKNNDVYAFGSNLKGQLGLERKVEFSAVPELVSALNGRHIHSAACGECHTAFISAKGQFYVCGDGRYGKLCKDVNNDAEDASDFTPQLVDRFDNYDVTMVACGGCHTMVHAAIKTPGDKGSLNGNSVDLILDPVENTVPNQNLQSGDSAGRLPRSARLPPLHVGKQNGSILESPSVEVAPENGEQITPPKQAAATPPKTVATPPKSVTSPPKKVTSSPPKKIASSPTKTVTSPSKAVTTSPTKTVTKPPRTTNASSPTKNTSSPPKIITASPTKTVPDLLENTKESDSRPSETENGGQMNGGDMTKPTKESLDEVLNKLNIKDASELDEFIAAENESKMEVEELGDDVTDKLAASGDTVILSEVMKIEPVDDGTSSETEKEEADENGKEDEVKVEDEKETGEEDKRPENGEEGTGEVQEANEEEKDKENEVDTEQKNDTDSTKEEKKPSTAEQVESRVSKFLSAFRRKKLSEGNIALSPAWTTVDRKISSDTTAVNNRKSDKPGVTHVKNGQPQRSKACVIL